MGWDIIFVEITSHGSFNFFQTRKFSLLGLLIFQHVRVLNITRGPCLSFLSPITLHVSLLLMHPFEAFMFVHVHCVREWLSSILQRSQRPGLVCDALEAVPTHSQDAKNGHKSMRMAKCHSCEGFHVYGSSKLSSMQLRCLSLLTMAKLLLLNLDQ